MDVYIPNRKSEKMDNMIARNIPNALTCCNLISGCIATLMAFTGDIKMALIWIIVGAVFDFFDGMSARLIGVSSPIGKELDSLADVITFGVAPSTMIFYQLTVIDYPSFLQASPSMPFDPYREFIPYIAFLMAAFSALRLAKFNIDKRQSDSFIGLPTPANALFWGSLLVTNPAWLEKSSRSLIFIIVLMCMSCYFLVSEIPMFALKFKQWGWKGNNIRYSFILLSIIILTVFGLLKGWWIVIGCYFIISLFFAITGRSKISTNEINKE